MLQFRIYDGEEVKVRIELFIEKKDGTLLKVMWNDPLFIKSYDCHYNYNFNKFIFSIFVLNRKIKANNILQHKKHSNLQNHAIIV